MKKILTTLLFLSMHFSLASLTASAQDGRPEVIKLWPNGAPTQSGITEATDGTYPGGIKANKEALLYVYRPQKANGQAIVCCPGGGYTHLASGHEGADMADWMNAQGITYCVLLYRMPNGHKEIPLDDVREALRQVRSHAADWNIDEHKVGIMGSSAGGHLASTAATHLTGNDAPDFQILFYPVITMDKSYTHMGSRRWLLGENPSQEVIDAYSNEKRVTDTTPQAFIVLSADDNVVPAANSLNYAQAMIAHNRPVTLHMYPYNGHGWGYRDSFDCKPMWTAELSKWLRDIR